MEINSVTLRKNRSTSVSSVTSTNTMETKDTITSSKSTGNNYTLYTDVFDGSVNAEITETLTIYEGCNIKYKQTKTNKEVIAFVYQIPIHWRNKTNERKDGKITKDTIMVVPIHIQDVDSKEQLVDESLLDEYPTLKAIQGNPNAEKVPLKIGDISGLAKGCPGYEDVCGGCGGLFKCQDKERSVNMCKTKGCGISYHTDCLPNRLQIDIVDGDDNWECPRCSNNIKFTADIAACKDIGVMIKLLEEELYSRDKKHALITQEEDKLLLSFQNLPLMKCRVALLMERNKELLNEIDQGQNINQEEGNTEDDKDEDMEVDEQQNSTVEEKVIEEGVNQLKITMAPNDNLKIQMGNNDKQEIVVWDNKICISADEDDPPQVLPSHEIHNISGYKKIILRNTSEEDQLVIIRLYEDMKKKAVEDGKKEGYKEGYAKGREVEMKEDMKKKAFDDGKEEGYKEGYAKGREVGMKEVNNAVVEAMSSKLSELEM